MYKPNKGRELNVKFGGVKWQVIVKVQLYPLSPAGRAARCSNSKALNGKFIACFRF